MSCVKVLLNAVRNIVTITTAIVFTMVTAAQANAQSVVVAAHGDSITAGTPYYSYSHNGDTAGAYQPYTRSRLSSYGISSAVYNYGHVGDFTTTMVNRMPSVLSRNPDYVLLQAGTNDLGSGIISWGTILTNYSAMTQQAQAAGATMILSNIIWDYSAPGKNIFNFNQQLPSLATSLDTPLCDQYEALRVGGIGYMYDLLHPNTAGYAAMGNKFADCIKAYVDSLIPPVAADDVSTSPALGRPVSIDILENDTDSDGTINVGSVDLDPARTGMQRVIPVTDKGEWEVDASGVVTFTPTANFSGTVTASYNVKDDDGVVSNVADIELTYRAPMTAILSLLLN